MSGSMEDCRCSCLARCLENKCSTCCGCDRALGDREDRAAGALHRLEQNMVVASALGSFAGQFLGSILRPDDKWFHLGVQDDGVPPYLRARGAKDFGRVLD